MDIFWKVCVWDVCSMSKHCILVFRPPNIMSPSLLLGWSDSNATLRWSHCTIAFFVGSLILWFCNFATSLFICRDNHHFGFHPECTYRSHSYVPVIPVCLGLIEVMTTNSSKGIADLSVKSSSATSNAILTYLRIRPNVNAGDNIYLDPLDSCLLHFDVPDFVPDFVNHLKCRHDFHFDGILPVTCSQTEVFEKIGKPCVKSFIEG